MKRSQKRSSSIKLDIPNALNSGLDFLHYLLLITVYVIYLVIKAITKKITFLNFLRVPAYSLIKKLDIPRANRVPRIELINLAVENMTSKKNRFLVTVGGMTVGIAGIVFLVSVGYGLQALVINRVARLDEMRQTDVSVLPGSNLSLNDESLDSFQKIENVDFVLPQIAVVAKVNYNNSLTDMAAYGVTEEYLNQSAISATIEGKIFDNNELKKDIKAIQEEQSETLLDENEYLSDNMIIVEGEGDSSGVITTTKVTFPNEIKDKYAVVNRSFLRVLAIEENEAIGKVFSVEFTSTDKSLNGEQGKIVSSATEYEIIGITPDDNTPIFYVPFIHLKALGITSYSQVKIVANDEENLTSVRTEIESQGFSTNSVVDTVNQINGLFSTARLVLALLGTIALFVAALGMFNTLTVSLLERTREVGLLKAMGMKSKDVKDLFLAESMIMSTMGGFLGIVSGLLLGKILETILSAYAIINNAGSITIIDMPILFTLLILAISFTVGIITGIYPARRATKISALNALRYE